jgi:hypothetical protein
VYRAFLKTMLCISVVIFAIYMLEQSKTIIYNDGCYIIGKMV